jgi:hypothetical protein
MRKYDIFIELYMKWTLLPAFEGSDSYKNVKNHLILESSLKCANGLLFQIDSQLNISKLPTTYTILLQPQLPF